MSAQPVTSTPVFPMLDVKEHKSIYSCRGFSTCELLGKDLIQRIDVENKQYSTLKCKDNDGWKLVPDPFDGGYDTKGFMCNGVSATATNQYK